MNYTALNDQLTGRCKAGRKLGNNTYAERRGDNIAIRLHSTDVLTYAPDGTVTVTSGGWKTHTTKDRLNTYLPNGHRISQAKGVWHWHTGQPFTDGDTIAPDGTVNAQRQDDKSETKLRKRIRKYAKLYADTIPLPEPSGGDCWYCCLVTAEDKGLGDVTNNTSHLESHMEEGYVVPSLAYHAMKEAGAGPAWFPAVFNRDAGFLVDSAKRQLPRWIARYMCRRFGLVA